MRLITPLFISIFFLSMSVSAHEDDTNYNRVSLDASATAEVMNDIIIVELYAQEEGSKADVLSDSVNRQINRALEHLRALSDIDVATKNYSVQPVYDKNRIVAWRVRQSIELRSKDIALVSGELGGLQQYLKLGQVSFDVSPELRREITRSLIDQSLDAYNQRAQQVTAKLARKSYKIVSMKINVPDSVNPYRYRAAHAMAESSVMKSPEFSPGKNTLKVRVDGTIELE